jgi:hypothetical protein
MSRIPYNRAKAAERFTMGQPCISTDHEYIHDGFGFRLVGVTPSISAGSTYDIRIVTPAAAVGYVHFRPALFASSANLAQITLTEAGTSTGGSAATPLNQNRNSSKTPNVGCTVGVTGTPGTPVIDLVNVGSGGSPSATRGGGGGGGENDEVVLKAGTVYILRIANIGSTTATVVSYNVFWYEELNG